MENFNIILAAGLYNSNINGMNKISGDVSEKRRKICELQQEICEIEKELRIYEMEKARNII